MNAINVPNASEVNCTLFARDINRSPALKIINNLYLPIVLAGFTMPMAIFGVLGVEAP